MKNKIKKLLKELFNWVIVITVLFGILYLIKICNSDYHNESQLLCSVFPDEYELEKI